MRTSVVQWQAASAFFGRYPREFNNGRPLVPIRYLLDMYQRDMPMKRAKSREPRMPGRFASNGRAGTLIR
jgi:hypothetical protein